MKNTKSAGGVVKNQEGKILVVNQRGTSWSLPKGHIEEGEDSLTASRREIEEESGEKVDRNKLLKIVQDKELIDSKGRWNYKAGAEFLKLSEKPRNNTELNEKKKLAASTTSDDKPETQPKDFKTQEDFRVNKPW